MQRILDDLQERSKELTCLYRVNEILSRPELPDKVVFQHLLQAIPLGWKHPESCRGVLTLEGRTWPAGATVDTPWRLTGDIPLHGATIGQITVYYTEERPREDEGPFLQEERRLVSAIAERIRLYVMRRRLRRDHGRSESAVRRRATREAESWKLVLDFLRRTDTNLSKRFTRRMINHLCWTGVIEAQSLLHRSLREHAHAQADAVPDTVPVACKEGRQDLRLTERTFELAARRLSAGEVMERIRGWLNEEASTSLIKSLEDPGASLAELAVAVERYQNARIDESELPLAVRTSLRVALIRRFLVDSLEFINLAKRYVGISDFFDLVRHMVFPSRSHGRLGGKGAGLFLATQIIRGANEYADIFKNLRTPKTWYVASDAILEFIQYNDLNEIYNCKYMETERVRHDYPHIIQLFKNSDFPPEIVKGLAAALDEFEDGPIIVRSSSLLEDRVGVTFSGKYKSLFLANRGTKKERLEALLEAIAEIYASVFGPDAIDYRAVRGLLDFREEMGVLIQEVVGKRVGRYFLPAFSGVASSSSDFRRSPQIGREDGLVRLVPGLGTRAVDRLADDHSLLLSPGQPKLRLGVGTHEVARHSPQKIDVINLERHTFETLPLGAFLRECGESLPWARQMVSIIDGDQVQRSMGREPDWQKEDVIVTFEGLLADGLFVFQMDTLLKVLKERLRTPVDIEFASDGTDLYLVQCRSQSASR